jgi:hypothetical protein
MEDEVIDVADSPEAPAEDTGVRINVPELISMGQLVENNWNPNVETDANFAALVNEIKEDGFDDPLLVVPNPVADGEPQTYTIIGGAHRFRAARVLGMSSVPCYVKSWDSIELQKLKTVRRNLIGGELDDSKFTALVASLKEKGFSDETLPGLLGFDDFRDYAKHLLKPASAEDDKKWVKEMKETSKELTAIDSVSDVLNNIFSNYAGDLPGNFMFFAYRGKTHLMVLMDGELFDMTEKMVNELRSTKVDICTFLKSKLKDSV